MAFDLLESLTGNCKLVLGRFLGLLDEDMEDRDHPSTAVAVKGPANAGAAFGPELEQAVAQGL